MSNVVTIYYLIPINFIECSIVEIKMFERLDRAVGKVHSYFVTEFNIWKLFSVHGSFSVVSTLHPTRCARDDSETAHCIVVGGSVDV